MPYKPKITLKTALKNYLDTREGWIIKGDLAKYAESLGFYGETAGRILRKMHEEGLILTDYEQGKRSRELVWYKHI
jgi:DNA-binding transcriptional regulator PaaX